MRKTLFLIIFAILIGLFLGKTTFDRYESLQIEPVSSFDKNVFALKYKTYKSLEDMEQDIINLDRYIYIMSNDKVVVYTAITKNKESINKIKQIYDSKGVKLKVQKITIDNEAFISNLNEYEKLLAATEDENSLMIIEKQILACYDEIMVNYE